MDQRGATGNIVLQMSLLILPNLSICQLYKSMSYMFKHATSTEPAINVFKLHEIY